MKIFLFVYFDIKVVVIYSFSSIEITLINSLFSPISYKYNELFEAKINLSFPIFLIVDLYKIGRSFLNFFICLIVTYNSRIIRYLIFLVF